MERVLGVLAGTDMPLRQIEAWALSAEVVLAADGGANVLGEMGLRVDAAVGDFDSITSAARQRAHEIKFDPNQDRSDCDKLLSLAVERGYSQITLCNVEGDRLDHVLATLQSAAKAPLSVRLALRSGLGLILTGAADVTLKAAPGETLSLLPLEHCEEVSLSGVAWPILNQALDARGANSLSNEVTAGAVNFRMDSGSVVLVLTSARLASPTW